jgi:hypothetical protein
VVARAPDDPPVSDCEAMMVEYRRYSGVRIAEEGYWLSPYEWKQTALRIDYFLEKGTRWPRNITGRRQYRIVKREG